VVVDDDATNDENVFNRKMKPMPVPGKKESKKKNSSLIVLKRRKQ